ncbi:hypothetical protein ACSDQ9_06210 [Aestuariimicrobium soli]|uniref:hypothetical protein n=1 Tax=Aestuariimicrobium soli TaxID=2035834 RepID=UPI003EBCCB95
MRPHLRHGGGGGWPGYVGYFALVFSNFDTLDMARNGAPATVLKGTPAETLGMWVFLIVVAGNLLGTLLLGVSIIIGRRRLAGLMPWWAGLLVIGWPLGHIINLVVTNEWFAVAADVLEVIGLVFVARGALRRDAEQAGRAA